MVHPWNRQSSIDDEPPFPANGLKPLLKSIQRVQEEKKWEGSFTLVATVSADGDVVDVIQHGLSPPAISAGAAAVLRRTKFKPARCGGQPCAMKFPLPINFRLKQESSIIH